MILLATPPTASTSFQAGPGGGCDTPARKKANLNFTLKDLNGRNVALSAYRGKVILLDFWTTWCAPCRSMVPILIDLYEKYQSQGLIVLGFSVDDSVSSLKRFADEFKMTYPVLVGTDHREVEHAFAIWGLPNTFLIDRNGNICRKHTGVTSKEQLEREIRPLL